MARDLRPNGDLCSPPVTSSAARAVEEFERSWARYCGTRHAIGVGNGTDALVLTLRALGLRHDDEVIVPANTFVATAEAVVLAGATPRFADVCPDTLLLTPEGVRAALTPRSRVLVVVQLYGQVADMDALAAVAAEAGLVMVEDAAQAHGARWRDRPRGIVRPGRLLQLLSRQESGSGGRRRSHCHRRRRPGGSRLRVLA